MMLIKKHVLAFAAAGAVAFGATSVPAAPVLTNTAAVKTPGADGITQVRLKKHKLSHRVQQSQDLGPFGLPFAAAAGAGAATGAAIAGAGTVSGALIGGTTAAVTGYPYWPYGDAYGSYAYAPAPYASFGWSAGHGYYNSFAAPASQDNCAVDGGYGRLDYGVAC